MVTWDVVDMADKSCRENESGDDSLSASPQSTVNTQPLNSWLQVSVKESSRRTTTSLKIQDSFVVYLVETKVLDQLKICPEWQEVPITVSGSDCASTSLVVVWRRYSEFDLLRDYLLDAFPSVVIPSLPGKRVVTPWQAAALDKSDPEFVEKRRVSLEQFLKRLCCLPEISSDPILLAFLKTDADWKKMVYSKQQLLKDSRLKALSAAYRIKRPNEKFEAIRRYANELEGHIGNLLKIRAKATEHLYGVHKIHVNYGREFSEWSSLERQDLADGLQKIGQYLDAFSEVNSVNFNLLVSY